MSDFPPYKKLCNVGRCISTAEKEKLEQARGHRSKFPWGSFKQFDKGTHKLRRVPRCDEFYGPPAAKEGVCAGLGETLARMKTSLPECAMEAENVGLVCSVADASGCPLGSPNFVLCVAKKEGLVEDMDAWKTWNMDAIGPIMTALGLEMPPQGPEGFLKRGRAIFNAVTVLAQQCQVVKNLAEVTEN